MRKTLQKKFVLTAMAAITTLLLVLLGAINIAHWWMVDQQIHQMLTLLVQAEGPPDQRRPPLEPQSPGLLFPPISDDRRLDARFFSLHLDGEGRVVYADLSHIATVTQEEAEAYAQTVRGEREGSVDRFRYLAATSPDGQRTDVVFLDVSSDRQSILQVLILSGGIGLLCWLGMLILVAALSRRAIHPVAASIEKQKQFVTNAGHELKTPLAIIQANTEAMELHQGENKWTRNIKAQTVRLSGLMQNLLTLARMDEGGELPPAQTVDLSALALEAVQTFREAAALRGIALEADILPGVTLRAHREHMAQLLSILLDNAVKYTHADGRIVLYLSRKGSGLRLQVRNTPAQLPEGDLSHLFDRFYRGDTARTQKSGGYGIGLSAAQAIVQAWNGTITAWREGEDTAVFMVSW